jgi:hydroxymethylpyrimidine/phosphomethylpyrimidine kinase
VLVKGGHAPRGRCRDCLALPDGSTHWYEVARVITSNTHGTGCVLSAAIAAWLGRGATLLQAVRFGQSFLHRSLERGRGIDWGRGRGPAYVSSR